MIFKAEKDSALDINYSTACPSGQATSDPLMLEHLWKIRTACGVSSEYDRKITMKFPGVPGQNHVFCITHHLKICYWASGETKCYAIGNKIAIKM